MQEITLGQKDAVAKEGEGGGYSEKEGKWNGGSVEMNDTNPRAGERN